MVNPSDSMASLLSRWWVRLLLFFCGFIIVNISMILPLMSPVILPESMNILADLSPLLLLILALGIEYARKEGNYRTLGFSVSIFTVKELLTGILLAVVPLGIIIGSIILFGGSLSFGRIFSESLLATLGVALLEEVVFRGMILRSLEQRFGTITAVLLSGGVFAAAHCINGMIPTLAIITVALAGVVFGMMYILTRSLWMPIAFHAVWNYIEYSVFGRNPDPAIFTGIPAQYRWLFIGEYGIEQGLCTTVFLIFIIVLLPSITTVSPYAAAADFKQKYAEARVIAT